MGEKITNHILDKHLEYLERIFQEEGLNLEDFYKSVDENEYSMQYSYSLDINYRFRISLPTYSRYCNVYCEPHPYHGSIYMGCDHFDDVISLAKVWANMLSHKLKNIPYIHKIFISHSNLDKDLVNVFVDKILTQACGLSTDKIVYTSLQSTGVGLGESIPNFIKDNIKVATYVFLMISDNYKNSEVCLNEMGAAWALDKKIISILLPELNFDKLGWLTSFDKAFKIDDEEALDKLYELLNQGHCKLITRVRDKTDKTRLIYPSM